MFLWHVCSYQCNTTAVPKLGCTSEAAGEPFGNQMVSKCRSSIRWIKRWGPEISIFQESLGYRRNLSRSGWLLETPYNKTRLKATLNLVRSSFDGSGDFTACGSIPTSHCMAKSETKGKFNTEFLVAESSVALPSDSKSWASPRKKCTFYACFVKGKCF